MTEKIFYDNAAVHSLTAEVVATGQDEKGHYAVLDRSCFYPEGGGQPADTGLIGDIEVWDVQTIEGEIRHYTRSMPTSGKFTAAIDQERRFDHMQQHTGQHLLSAVFDDELGMATTSFHLGADTVTIDLNAAAIQTEQLKAVEQRVNELIRLQLRVETEWVTKEQAEGMQLRKQPAVEGDIRLVKIADIDINPCGGTHLKNTGELGLIKILRTEKSKSATRVYFLCGNRAIRHFDLLQSVTDQLTRSLNAPAADLPEAAAQLVTDRKEKEKQLKKLTLRLLELEAESFQEDNGFIVKEFRERPFKEVQQLAKLAANRHPASYVFFLVTEAAAIRFVCAKGKDAAGNMKRVADRLAEQLGGNAGGTEAIAQSGGPSGNAPEKYIAAFKLIIEENRETL